MSKTDDGVSGVPPAPQVVLAPGFGFADLEARLAETGWAAQPAHSLTPSILPGEPETAAWRKDDVLLTYSFNPVVRFRVLDATGIGAGMARAELEQALPVLDAPAIDALLRSADARALILGALATAALGALTLVPRLVELQEHPERHVAAAARTAVERLGRRVLASGLDRLAREKAARPDRSTWFPRLGDAVIRRQAVRSIPRTVPASEGTVALLRSALEDEDWEVRASAMVLAAALCPRSLAVEVRRLQIPVTGYPRPFGTHLDALRDLHRRFPDHSRVPESILRAFTTPQPELAAETRDLHGVRLHHVPAGAYAVGSDDEFADVNPYRIVETAGFWISDPVGPAVDRPAVVAAPGCRLPTGAEWEMAMRGADARQFPWGNSVIRAPQHAVTWCGAAVAFDELPEWTSDALCAGAFHDARCAARQEAPAGARCRFRLVPL